MAQIFPIDFDEKLTMAQDDYILFSDSEDGNKIKKAQYKNLKGEKGDPGTPGTPGKDGEDGAAATVTVGSVSTLPAGSSATVTNSGTSSAAVLNFGIPEGATGAAGADGKDGTDGKDGKDGTDGAAATITVGTTTTLPAGSSATVTNVGTSSAAVFNFGIPKGDSGIGSGDVNGPASSTDGDVAIFDGSTGKLIKDGSVALSTLSSGASLAATAIQPGDNVSDLNNDSGFITGITSLDVTTALGYTPYNSSNPDGYTTNTGDVVGPGSSTDGHLALFDGATGKLIKDGGAVPTGVPTVGTDGQVLTVVSGSAAWAAPSGGDVLVSDQANNIFTPGMKIWGGTEGDFNNLTPDSNTAYLLIAGGPTPGGWQPGVNTLVYLPFTEDLLDHSGNGVTFTQGGTNLSIVNGVADFDGGYLYKDASYGLSSLPATVSLWLYARGLSQTGETSIINSHIYSGGYNGRGSIITNDGKVRLECLPGSAVDTSIIDLNKWYYLTLVLKASGSDLYFNGQKIGTTNSGLTLKDRLAIGTAGWTTSDFGNHLLDGQMSQVIIEDKERTAQEIQDYFDQTKGDYGIS